MTSSLVIPGISKKEKGAINGVAELDENGKVPDSQISESSVVQYASKAEDYININSSAGVLTIDASLATSFRITTTENITSTTIINAPLNKDIGLTLFFTQNATTPYTWNPPAGSLWDNGISPMLTQAASAKDTFGLVVHSDGVGVVEIQGFTGAVNLSREQPFFISSWKTDNAGTSSFNQITIPTTSLGSYNCTVDWGDGNIESITSYNDPAWTHTYYVAGEYDVSIQGVFTGFRFNNGGDRLKLLDVKSCGPLNLGNEGSYFYGCENLVWTATDVLDTTGTTDFSKCFRQCYVFNGAIGNWEMSSVINIAEMFNMVPFTGSNIVFNQDLNNWDLSSCDGNFTSLFASCQNFNGDLNFAFVPNITNLAATFYFTKGAPDFTNWQTKIGTCTTMEATFNRSTVMLANLASIALWDVSNVTNMNAMFFRNAPYLNMTGLDFSLWNTSKVTTFRIAFIGTNCDSSIAGIDTSSATSFENTFAFSNNDHDFSGYDFSNVTTATGMLNNAGLSTANLDALYISLNSQILQSGVSFSAGTTQYSAGAPAAARANIISTYGWTITDGGQAT
jgi:hypothetical protein